MERTVDLTAVNRVSTRVELKGVRLVAISAACNPSISGPSLRPEVNLDCKLGNYDATTLEVICDYTFVAHSDQEQAIESTIRYLLQYELAGTETAKPSDLAEFANANGALHSWPFVREMLYGLTSRMGFPPYTLPLMHFKVEAPPNEQTQDGVQNKEAPKSPE